MELFPEEKIISSISRTVPRQKWIYTQTRVTLEEIVPDSCDESGTFSYRIGFAVYTQEDESEMKTPRFGHVSRDFQSGI